VQAQEEEEEEEKKELGSATEEGDEELPCRIISCRR
jgi:hypothetical protein